jgi:hypothetical protein
MITIKAINKKYQSKVNKAVRTLLNYNHLNDVRDKADSSDDKTSYRIANRMCEKLFDTYLEVCSELPKREVAQIEKALY